MLVRIQRVQDWPDKWTVNNYKYCLLKAVFAMTAEAFLQRSGVSPCRIQFLFLRATKQSCCWKQKLWCKAWGALAKYEENLINIDEHLLLNGSGLMVSNIVRIFFVSDQNVYLVRHVGLSTKMPTGSSSVPTCAKVLLNLVVGKN